MKRIFNYFLFLEWVYCFGFAQAQNYFPLAIANRWDFVDHKWDANGYSEYDTLSLNIYADTLINNEKYYRITSNPWVYNLIRSDSVGIYFYDTVNNQEWLFFKYNLPLGQYLENGYNLSPLDTNSFIRVYKSLDDTVYLFNQSLRRMRYSIDKGIDNAYSLTITPHLGFLDIDASNVMSNENIGLLGCIISDTIYGKLTSVENIREMHQEYALFQNYPNPFNQTTIISYSIPESQLIEINIFDILGRRITTLIKEYKQGGIHTIEFNGFNLTSGIYYYQLNAGTFIQTKKFILLK
jgi:hypothetical protein